MTLTEKELLAKVPTKLYIGGNWVTGRGEKPIAVEDPATGKVLLEIANATAEDGLAALTAAADAQVQWAKTAPRERSEILRRTFELVRSRSEEFAMLISMEMGKPLAEARGEVAYGNEFLRWFAEEAVRITGRYGVSPEGTGRMLVAQRPVGPAFAITPWNFPLAMATRKIGPALAAGCTMVVKPAELTPLTTLLLVATLEEAGLPAGVVNVITTSTSSATSAPIISDSRLRKITFTGSTEVGVRLLEQSAKQVLRTSMELGGNAPFVVFEDADLDAAVSGAMLAKLRNNPETKIGPVINQKARENLERLVKTTLSEGAAVVTGGKSTDGAGYFFEPTVLMDVKPGSTILGEEIFGPIAPIVRFKTEKEAIDLANDTVYGLVSYAYTQDLKRGLRLIEQLDTGMTGLNTGLVSNAAAPFGGVKQSGLGREGGLEGINEYLETKYVMIPDPSN